MTLGVATAAVRLIMWCRACAATRSKRLFSVREPASRYGDWNSPLDRSGMDLETAKVFEDREWPGDWRLGWIDYDGGVEVAVFSGPNAPSGRSATPIGNTAISRQSA